MSKKGKITVKRFFNTKVNEIKVYNDIEKGHPLYYSITYKRKTQRIKSFTGAVMTLKAFNYLEETNEPLSFETNFLQNNSSNNITLQNELNFIYKAVEYIVYNEENENIFDEEFKDRLKRFFNNLEEALYYIGWQKYKHIINPIDKINKKIISVKELHNYKFKFTNDEKTFNKQYKNFEDYQFFQQKFYDSFNQNNDLIRNLEVMKSVLKIDLKPFIYSDTIKFWHVINLIKHAYYNTICIDFIVNYDIEKIVNLSKTLKSFPIDYINEKEIRIASKTLKNKVLLFL